MVLHVSDLEPCENRDIHAPISNNYDQNKIGYVSRKKKRLHPRTEEDNGDDNDQNKTELPRKKKTKKKKKKNNDLSSSSDHSCFVAHVTASNLHKDALYLPQDFTTSNGFKRECRRIVLKHEGEQRSWKLKLRFKKSSKTFYVKRGWRCFCDENGRKAGGFFKFNLVRNGEILVLSFGSTESGSDNRRQRECLEEASEREERPMVIEISSEEEKNIEKEESIENECSSLEIEKKENNLRVTLTITPYSFRNCKLRLPIKFTRENNINKPGMITLLGKDGVKYRTLLLLHSGAMVLGIGLKGFLKVNGLKTGDSFTLKLIWEDTNPVLTLCSVAKATSKKESLHVESNKEERKKNLMECGGDSTSPSKNRFVTLTLTRDNVRKCRLHLPLIFVIENGITKPGMMTLLDKDGTKRMANLRRDCFGKMSLGKGFRDFAKANDLKIGESFTLELIWENETPMLRLFSSIESTTSDRRRQEGECSKASEASTEEPCIVNKAREAKNNREEMRTDSSSPIQNRFVTLTLIAEDAKASTLDLPSGFMKANNINKLGKISLFGKRRMNWFDGYLLRKDGLVALGCGWKSFCEANGVNIGESFTLKFIYEKNTEFVFKFCSNSGD